MRKSSLPPTEYKGQPLCPRCGVDSNGDRFVICVDKGWTHEETCAIYNYVNLCNDCIRSEQ